MTQTLTLAQTPAARWSQALQIQLMAALDTLWTILDRSDDPAEIRRARDKAKAIGDLAAMARKVAQIVPVPRAKPGPNGDAHGRPDLSLQDLSLQDLSEQDLALQDLARSVEDFETRVQAQPRPGAPAAQVEQTRRALAKLKGGRRGRP
jgi:hypothetical protein